MRKLMFCCWIIGLLLLHACYEEQEGCLDPVAVNYDVSADFNGGCTYPALSFSVDHQWGDSLFSYDSLYRDVEGDTFQIRFIGLFVRELAVDTGTAWVRANATDRDWPLRTGSTRTEGERIGLIESRNFSTQWGRLSYLGAFEEFRMTLGLGALDQVDPGSIDSEHPLNLRSQMYDTLNKRYVGWAMSFRTDTSADAELQWVRSENEWVMNWTQSFIGEWLPGENSQLEFELDYELLLANFRIDATESERRNAVNDQWQAALRLRE